MKKVSTDVEEGRAWAFIGVFLGLIGFVLILLAKRENKYAMYYGKQGLVLTIAGIIISFVSAIPFIGWVIGFIGWIILLILWIMGLVYSISGEEKEIPIIGEFANKIKI